jgi:ribonuclease M5
MTRDVILDALRVCGATFLDSANDEKRVRGNITTADLYELGLSGTANAAARRGKLLASLGLPALLKGRGLLDTLNCLYTLDELKKHIKSSAL